MWELDYKESWAPKNWCFELWCWRRLLRVPWTARTPNQSILKEVSPGCSLEGLMLKLKLQYLGHLMRRVDSLEKTLMLEKIEGRRRREDRGWDGWMASPTPGVRPNPCPSSRWCHPAISSYVVPSPPAPNPSQHQGLFQWVNTAWGGQSTGVSASASVLPKKSQGWSPSEWTSWISLQSKALSRVFSNTTVQKHQFFGAELSSQSNSHMHLWLLKKTIALTRRTFVGKVMSLLLISCLDWA